MLPAATCRGAPRPAAWYGTQHRCRCRRADEGGAAVPKRVFMRRRRRTGTKHRLRWRGFRPSRVCRQCACAAKVCTRHRRNRRLRNPVRVWGAKTRAGRSYATPFPLPLSPSSPQGRTPPPPPPPGCSSSPLSQGTPRRRDSPHPAEKKKKRHRTRPEGRPSSTAALLFPAADGAH